MIRFNIKAYVQFSFQRLFILVIFPRFRFFFFFKQALSFETILIIEKKKRQNKIVNHIFTKSYYTVLKIKISMFLDFSFP